MASHHRKYKYKNIVFLLTSIVLAIILIRIPEFHDFLLHVGKLGYAGAFLAGAMFTSTFTIATATLILMVLAETLSPLEIGLIAGMGAVIGDLLIFRFVKDGLADEIAPIFNDLTGSHFNKVLYTRYFSWMLPVVGAAIIASPLPDELGVSLMGISEMKMRHFIPVSFALNSFGILVVVTLGMILRI